MSVQRDLRWADQPEGNECDDRTRTLRTRLAQLLRQQHADRARDFPSRIEASNVGAQTLDQLADDVRWLVIANQQQPLASYLGDVVDTQDRAFTLLEGRQRPEQSRNLYLVTGITSGLMADASHDLGAAHDAMTQARTGYACADNAGHFAAEAGAIEGWTAEHLTLPE